MSSARVTLVFCLGVWKHPMQIKVTWICRVRGMSPFGGSFGGTRLVKRGGLTRDRNLSSNPQNIKSRHEVASAVSCAVVADLLSF